MSHRSVVVCTAMLCWVSCQASTWGGGNSTSAKFYGQGVHQFFEGRYFEAIKNFDLATSYDADDARIYLFRGIAKRRLGWTYDAAADMQMGAQIEAMNRRSDVGRALQRIQGPERFAVERHRREARKLDAETLQSLMQSPTPAQIAKEPTPAAQPDSTADHQRVQFEALPDDATDPFANEADGVLLGRGVLQPSGANDFGDDPGTESAVDDEFAMDDEPFGTGVADDDQLTDGEELDVFGDDEAFQDAPDAMATEEPKKRGVFGAAIRAFGRTITPSIPQGVPGIGGIGQPADAPDDDFEAADDDDPFGADFGQEAEVQNDVMPADDDPGDPFQDDAF